MINLVTLLNVTFLALCEVDLRRLSNDSGLEPAATLLGTKCCGNSNSKCNDSGHDGFEGVSLLLYCTSRYVLTHRRAICWNTGATDC